MRSHSLLSFFLTLSGCLALPNDQSVFKTRERPWNAKPSPDATGHLIFNTVSSLLQHWPGTLYVNGHTFVPGTVPAGTVLYHVPPPERDEGPPTSPEWLAFDPEHSYLFCAPPTCHMFVFTAQRDLRIGYFDGSSAAKLRFSGAVDTQEVIITNGTLKESPGGMYDEWRRIRALCAWGSEFGLDGFVRTEVAFELMLCDTTPSGGMDILSNLQLVAPAWDTRRLPPPPNGTIPVPPPSEPTHSPDSFMHPRLADALFDEPPSPTAPPRRPFPIPTGLPPGWVGSLRDHRSVTFEAVQAGSWHNFLPGETRVRLDYSRLVTFYNPALKSLVEARRVQRRQEHRVANISLADAKAVRSELREVLSRKDEGSGVDWRSLHQVVIDRYAQRLDYLRLIFDPVDDGATYRNATQIGVRVRSQLLVMLMPYMIASATPSNYGVVSEDWVAPIARHCSTTLTAGIPRSRFTPQERILLYGVEETLHEICRVLSLMWSDAFSMEGKAETEVHALVDGWRESVGELMDWLDWPMWVTCHPACKANELCYLPTWPWGSIQAGDEKLSARCVPREGPNWSL